VGFATRKEIMKRLLVMVLLAIIAGAGLWTWFALSWDYSSGERAGVLQKLSRKGWVCKTDEGELAMYIVSGIQPQIWAFSVRDAATMAELNKVVGRKVQLHYTEHPGVPSTCFAESAYFVDQVSLVDNVPGP
jgi:hypothetical protein